MGRAKSTTDDRITKRQVVMRSASLAPEKGPKGEDVYQTWEAVDYVREDLLDAYVAEARTRWQIVEVAEGYDAGPGGYEGATYVPDRLDHPLAGTYYPAFDCGPDCSHAPEGAHVVYIAPEEA